MATILLTWELGGGLGHLVNLVPLARRFCESGHRVFAALRDMSRAETLFAGMGVSYLRALVKLRRDEDRFDPPRTFPHILHNSGYGRDAATFLRTAVHQILVVLEQTQIAGLVGLIEVDGADEVASHARVEIRPTP